jgi:HK97 family phage major capsid protein
VSRLEKALSRARALREEERAAREAEAARKAQEAEETHARIVERFEASRAENFEAQQSPYAAAQPPTLRDELARSLDYWTKRGVAPDTAERLTRVARAEDAGDDEAPWAAGLRQEWAAATASPDYVSAFRHVLMSPQDAHLRMTPAEHAAYRRVDRLRAPLATSGYVLPSVLDPTIMLTNDGTISPIRQLARRVTTTTSTWRGIVSAGATAEWKSEGQQAADGTPGVAEVEIPTHFQDVTAVASYEVIEDSLDFIPQMTEVITDALAVHEAAALAVGTGSGQPEGLVTGLTPPGSSSYIITSQGETLTAASLYDIQNALPARFSPGASWLMALPVMNTIRQFTIGTANGAWAFPEMRDNPPSLLNRLVYETSNLDSTWNASATASNYVVVYGNVAAAYIIVDRIGTSIEILPGYGANNRPTGQRILFVHRRLGAEVVRPQAARVVNVATAA